MNLSLIQRPKRVSASSDTLYIYAPSVLMEGSKLKPKTIIKILEVHEGDSPKETSLKVMEHKVWKEHTFDGYLIPENQCTLMLQRKSSCDTPR